MKRILASSVTFAALLFVGVVALAAELPEVAIAISFGLWAKASKGERTLLDKAMLDSEKSNDKPMHQPVTTPITQGDVRSEERRVGKD